MTQGLCTSLPGACTKAAKEELIDMSGPDPRCPECGSSLLQVGKANNRRALVIGAGVGLFAAVSGGAWWALRKPKLPGESAGSGSGSGANETVEVLRLHGSNTLGAALAPALVDAFLKAGGYSDITHAPGAKPEESVTRGKRISDGQSIAVEILAHGTSQAFTALRDGKADIGMASRRISGDELLETKALGDLSSAGSEYVIALDGVAVIVNSANSVARLRIAQIRDLFSGRITDWADVGGRPGPVSVYARDEQSGTHDTFKSLVMGREKLVSTAQRYESSKLLADAVVKDAGGIGFVGLPYVGSSQAVAVSDGDALSLRPTHMTVGSEDYPLTRRLFLYVPPRSTTLARRFADFALTDAGQQIVNAVGFVGWDPGRMPDPSEPEGAPADYLRLTKGARPLASLRFEFGSTRLDNAALPNVRRIVRLIEAEAGRATVRLMGFADNVGDAHLNVKLSRDRADFVANELRSYGVDPQAVQGFGQARPVASNETDAGRARNRRVEVWITQADH